MASSAPAPRFNRAPAPARRGTGAFHMADSARNVVVARPVVLEVQDSGPSKQVPVQRPARRISPPVNYYAVLRDNATGDNDFDLGDNDYATGDDDDYAAAAEGAAA